jgi:hypothetical protein
MTRRVKRKAKRKIVAKAYHSLVTLPDRLYPFGCEVQGQWVRGVRSYDLALARAFRKYGPGHYGFRLSFYRQCFHFAGSLLVLYACALVALHFFDSATAFSLLLGLATAFISYQEFVLQRREYHQLWRKGLADWLVWVLPMGLYLFFFS